MYFNRTKYEQQKNRRLNYDKRTGNYRCYWRTVFGH